jgi:KDO2-lipid IV(A) lauroyltransferase
MTAFTRCPRGPAGTENETMNEHNENMLFDAFPAPLDQIKAYTRRYTRQAPLKGHYGTRFVLFVMSAGARRLSWKWAYRVGGCIGRMLYLLKIRRDVAMTNLDIVYGETKTDGEKERIYRKSLLNLGQVVINYFRLPHMGPDFWQSNCEWKNEHILRDAMNRKKGALLIAGHIGMMDLAGGKLGWGGYPVAVIGKNIKNPVIDRFVIEGRKAMNLGTINPKNSMARIMEGIRRREAIAMAIDQNMKKKYGIFLDWMGRTASCVRSAAYVARETGVPVVTGYMAQTDVDRFELVITEAIEWESVPDDPQRELAINAQKQSDALQRIVYDKPELWFWIHRRYKYQPDGVPNPYKKNRKAASVSK